MRPIDNVNLRSSRPLITPAELTERVKVSERGTETIFRAREEIKAILGGRDKRLMVITGPCSIHDMKLAREYAERLRALAEELQDSLLIIMRVYFEKPRTTVGWKGLITDPKLDDSFRIDEGLQLARSFLVDLAEMGLPAATEFVDPVIPQFVADLVSWTAIGARTAESQKHREMASGLSSPVGIKNGTDGNLTTAINGLLSVSKSHQFLGVNKEGVTTVFETSGNADAHIVVRGGKRPNYDSVSIRICEEELTRAGLDKTIMVDCSHGNSRKDHTLQPMVFRDCMKQITAGTQSIIGLMLESNIRAGKQKLKDPGSLDYGVSITDACIDWETTETLLREAADLLQG